MRALLVFLTILFISNDVTAQKKYIVILDSLTRKSIPDVYLRISEKNTNKIIAYSDENGMLAIDDLLSDSLSLTLIHISYANKNICKSDLTNKIMDTILLITKKVSLSDVIVSNFSSKKSTTIGYYKKGEKQNLHSPSNTSIFGTKISIDPTIKSYKIQELYFEFKKLDLIEKRKSSCRVGIVFHFLKFSTTGPINEDIIDPIVVDYDLIKENFKLGIPYSPIIENYNGAIFVGIQLQPIDCGDQVLSFKNHYLINKKSDENLNWIYQSSQKTWKQYNNSLFSGKLGVSLKILYNEN